MSGVPPIPPPYDPKAQYRAYHEQQKAAMRAQRAAWKASYGQRVPSIVGPILLIAAGIIALLVITGRIPNVEFWTWYSRWWPLLLIAAGLALLGEWALDMRRQVPVRRRSAGFIGILIVLAIVGMAHHNWGPFHAQFSGDDFNAFGLPEHDTDQQIQSAEIPAGAMITIQNPRGDISVASGDGQTITVQAHQVAYSTSDSEAQKIFDAEAAHLTANGSTVQVKSDGSSSGRLNLTVTVPKNAHVTINSGKGDVTAASLGAGLTINSVHGDTHLNAIAGSVLVHFANSRQDFSAHQIDGDLTADGNTNDVTISEIKGRVSINGEIFGEVHMENIGGPINLHTPVTDLQVGSLPGDMSLDSDDLRVTDAKGTVHVVTHSKDVDLSMINGEIYAENRDGRIAVAPAGNFNVEAKNSKGDIELTLPPNASASLSGRARNGDILTEFGLATSGDETKIVAGKIGSGQARISLLTENGDLSIKRGSNVENVPVGPATPAAPHAPHAAAPHLKGSHKQQLQQPITQ